MAVLGLGFCARAFSSCSKQGPLFIAVRGPLTIAASLVAEHRLQTRRLSNCGSRAQLLRGTWDLPRPGLEPASPALAGRFLTTAPPGKSPWNYLSKQSYPPAGTRGQLTLLLLQDLPSTAPSGSLCPWLKHLLGLAWHVLSSCLGCENTWLINCRSHLSSVSVVYLTTFYDLGHRISPSAMGWIGSHHNTPETNSFWSTFQYIVLPSNKLLKSISYLLLFSFPLTHI